MIIRNTQTHRNKKNKEQRCNMSLSPPQKRPMQTDSSIKDIAPKKYGVVCKNILHHYLNNDAKMIENETQCFYRHFIIIL